MRLIQIEYHILPSRDSPYRIRVITQHWDVLLRGAGFWPAIIALSPASFIPGEQEAGFLDRKQGRRRSNAVLMEHAPNTILHEASQLRYIGPRNSGAPVDRGTPMRRTFDFSTTSDGQLALIRHVRFDTASRFPVPRS
ncbi:hypothetical protein KM043_015354 [Ampulex compressa]|nr:hypothetical protein KM043_015354 [Ampulex compressa]